MEEKEFEALINVLKHAKAHGADENACIRIAGSQWPNIKGYIINNCHPKMRETDNTILILPPKYAKKYLEILENS